MPLTRSAASRPAMFENYSKYDKESKDAKRLNRGLADFICLDQVPVYRVKKIILKPCLAARQKIRHAWGKKNNLMYNEIPKVCTETRRGPSRVYLWDNCVSPVTGTEPCTEHMQANTTLLGLLSHILVWKKDRTG